MELINHYYFGEKRTTHYQVILYKKFMMHILSMTKLKKKNFFITSFFVLRLSIFFLFKKIKQKII